VPAARKQARGPGGQSARAGQAHQAGSFEGPLDRIRGALPELSGALRAAAGLVLANAWEVRGLSIHEFAARAGVSAHAVNRLSRRLGYTGYRDFLQSLAMELGQMVGAAYAIPEPLARQIPTGASADDPLTIVSRVFALEIAALHDTQRVLDGAALRRAVDAIASAESVLFVSTGAGLAISELGVYRLKVLGIRAANVADQASMVAEMHLLPRGGVVVGVTYHGQAAGVLEALALARQRELTTISITAVPGSPAAKAAEIQLVVSSEAEALGFGQFASRVTTATLLEALAAAVAWKRRESALPHANNIWLDTQRLNPPPMVRRAERLTRPATARARAARAEAPAGTQSR
jgi:DNA-binding MurR/RpiR family transcriptional regulator